MLTDKYNVCHINFRGPRHLSTIGVPQGSSLDQLNKQIMPLSPCESYFCCIMHRRGAIILWNFAVQAD